MILVEICHLSAPFYAVCYVKINEEQKLEPIKLNLQYYAPFTGNNLGICNFVLDGVM